MQMNPTSGRALNIGPRRRVPRPQEPEGEEKPPQTVREKLAELRRNARATLSGLPRAMRIVWEAHRGFTVSMAFFSVLFGIIPTATAWVSKLLIDAVVAAVQSGGSAEKVNVVVQLVLVQFGLFVGSSLLQTVRNINQQA